MRKRAVIFWTTTIFTAAYGLYEVKWQVRELREQNLLTEAEIIAQKRAIEVLEAEWTYQTRPDRIEKLARLHLPNMAPGAGSQMAEMGEFPPPAIEQAPPTTTPANGGLTYSSFNVKQP